MCLSRDQPNRSKAQHDMSERGLGIVHVDWKTGEGKRRGRREEDNQVEGDVNSGGKGGLPRKRYRGQRNRGTRGECRSGREERVRRKRLKRQRKSEGEGKSILLQLIPLHPATAVWIINAFMCGVQITKVARGQKCRGMCRTRESTEATWKERFCEGGLDCY